MEHDENASASIDSSMSNNLVEPNKVMSHFLIEDDFGNKKRFSTTHKRIFYMLTSLAILATVVLLIVFLLPRGWEAPKKKTNIIMMIGDGMGPAALTMARVCFKQENGKPISEAHLNLDPYVVGTVKTYSSNSIVTDSAAAATAYASGIKTYNYAIGVDDNKKPIGTVMEAAKAKGMKTGVVVTTRISDATPACYFSHSALRQDESFIISQLLEKDLDIVLGGGKMYFTDAILANASSSKHNYSVVYNKEDMMKVQDGKIMGLFGEFNLPWEIDRLKNNTLLNTVPSLQEMTIKALDLISQNNENGFLIMIEGSKIDVAAHINDAATQIYETNAFDETFEIVRKWAENDGNTIVIVTADHETGGLTLANQPIIDGHPLYTWLPDILLSINKSSDQMATLIKAGGNMTEILLQYANVKLTDAQIIQINSSHGIDSVTGKSFDFMNQVIGRIVSNSADIGFTTGGHTGEDVNLYTFGDTISQSKFDSLTKDKKDLNSINNYLDPILKGNINNVDIASFIIQTLDLDIESITQKLATFIPIPK